jgi:hypothetical protein
MRGVTPADWSGSTQIKDVQFTAVMAMLQAMELGRFEHLCAIETAYPESASDAAICEM